MSLANEIALRWIAGRPGCTGETAHGMRMAAEKAAKGFEQAEKDVQAEALQAETSEPETEPPT